MLTEQLCGDKEQCCGCAACYNACIKQAIMFKPDLNGFYYPFIDSSKCIDCGKCLRVCNYKSEKCGYSHKICYAGASKEESVLDSSSSGGVFATLAISFMKSQGVIYGCSLKKINGRFVALHTRISELSELSVLQGSKYVQSYIGSTYKDAKKDLDDGKLVMFVATPCQIAGLKKFLQGKSYDNLYCVDIICHGVPSITFFQSYIAYLEKKKNVKIDDFVFRDKKYGWSVWGSAIIKKHSKKSKMLQNRHNSAYYHYFLSGDIYRESCYSCKYASSKRIGDITIGDFWGVEIEYPSYLFDKGGDFKRDKGISCVLVNSDHGLKMIENYGKKINLLPANFDKIRAHNGQLNKPVAKSNDKDIIMSLFIKGGYSEVDKMFRRKLGFKKYIYYIWDMIPQRAKKGLKNTLNKFNRY